MSDQLDRLDVNYKNYYFDLDDTLLFHNDENKYNSVNYKLIGYIYKILNEDKKIALITKHNGGSKSLKNLLKNFRLYGLFSFKIGNIIHIKNKQHKADFIDQEDSILIDNSTYEREDAESRGVPAIDPKLITDYYGE